MTAPPEVIAAAREYFNRGYQVVAVKANKAPWGKNWRRAHNLDEVLKLLEEADCPAIGFLGGELNHGIVPIDFDSPEGETWFRVQCEAAGIDPWEFPMVITPGKIGPDGRRRQGCHRYVTDIRGTLSNATGPLLAELGIDIRGRGHAMLPPSPHPDGGTYQWMLAHSLLTDFPNGVPPCPLFLYEAIEARYGPEGAAEMPREAPAEPAQGNGADHGAEASFQAPPPPGGGAGAPGGQSRAEAYCRAALAGATERLAAAPKGRRNHELNVEALGLGHLAHFGVFTEGQALASLMAACTSNGLLADSGVKACHATFYSGWNKGLTEPKELPDDEPPRPGFGSQGSTGAGAKSDWFAKGADYSGDKQEQPVEPLEIRDFGTWTDLAAPRQWLVAGHYPWGLVGMISGDGGVGKTLLMQQLATCVALGIPWLGFSTMQCRVLTMFCEDDEDDVHRRQDDINRHYGILPEDLLGRLQGTFRAGEDSVLLEFDQNTNAPRPQPLFEAMRRKILAWKPGFLLLDTLADIYGGNENVRIQVRRFISALRKVAKEANCTILLTAHPSLTGMATGSGSSGSTHWNNGVRARSYLTRPTIGEGKDKEINLKSPRRFFKTMKSNWGSTGDEVDLLWASGVFIRADQDPIAANAGVREMEDYFLACLDKLTEQGRFVSANPKAGNYAPRILAQQPENPGFSKANIDVAMNALFHEGLIKIEEYETPSRHQAERIARSQKHATDD